VHFVSYLFPGFTSVLEGLEQVSPLSLSKSVAITGDNDGGDGDVDDDGDGDGDGKAVVSPLSTSVGAHGVEALAPLAPVIASRAKSVAFADDANDTTAAADAIATVTASTATVAATDADVTTVAATATTEDQLPMSPSFTAIRRSSVATIPSGEFGETF
jgi:hypothetical protein